MVEAAGNGLKPATSHNLRTSRTPSATLGFCSVKCFS